MKRNLQEEPKSPTVKRNEQSVADNVDNGNLRAGASFISVARRLSLGPVAR